MPEMNGNTRFVYEFESFIVDPSNKTIAFDSRSIQIPPKEFETLLLLIENNGRVVPKSEMMSTIWRDTFVEEGNLATYVSRLRKIINRNGQKLIETVPKIGYRFNADLRKNYQDQPEFLVVERHSVKKLELELETGSSAHRSPRTHTQKRKRLLLAGAGIATVLVLSLTAAVYFRRNVTPAAPAIRSMAVLPFRPINADDDSQALGIGLADALTSKVGSVRRIIVRPTSAVVRLSNSENLDSVEIGRRLAVDAVLEGTIQIYNEKLRINARLLRVQNGEQIWAESFDEANGDVLAVEDKLSAKIADTLSFKLTHTESERLARRGTTNADAYEKYLRGRFFQRQNTAEGLTHALELYQEALALDPDFADADAGIADAELVMYNFGLVSRSEAIPKARKYVQRALTLRPDVSYAYTSLAMIQFLADRDWTAAEASLKEAIALNPSNADAYHRYGYFLMNVGKFDESLEMFRQAQAIDPLSPIVGTGIGSVYLYSRRFPDAIRQYQSVAEDNPSFSMPEWFLGTGYECIGNEEAAFDANIQAMELDGDAALAEQLESIRQAKGVTRANTEWLNQMLHERESKHVPSIDIALRYATLADRENTLKWIEKSYDEGEPTIDQISFLSKYDFLRDDPRFQDLEKRLKFK
ncbi:MAG TPA: winged helix-turn-helix domain-containing protein [Pyrinomonadaceae bacterium]|nr:winged helix-turn-helix domain-containing protein [Pyrinomonadaceae bacterium]